MDLLFIAILTTTSLFEQVVIDACRGEERCICSVGVIARHESHEGTRGAGARNNNPCNLRGSSTFVSERIRDIRTPSLFFARFPDMETGIRACADLWQRNYRLLSARAAVRKWTQNENEEYIADLALCGRTQ